MKNLNIAVGLVFLTGLAVGSYRLIGAQRASAQTQETVASPSGFATVVPDNSDRTLKEGQQTFRFENWSNKQLEKPESKRTHPSNTEPRRSRSRIVPCTGSWRNTESGATKYANSWLR